MSEITMPKISDEAFLKLLNDAENPESLKKDILFTVLICIMTENGFAPLISETETLDSTSQINFNRVSAWKLSSGLYEAQFILRGFTQKTFKLIVTPLSDSLVVNLIIRDLNSETYSMGLKVDQYIDLSNPKLFRDLSGLVQAFMNKITSPVKSRILNSIGYPGASLIGLPEDVFLKLMFYLPVFDIVNVRKTCKQANIFIHNNYFWYKLYKRDYPTTLTPSLQTDWRMRYKGLFVKKKYVRREPPVVINRTHRGALTDEFLRIFFGNFNRN